ncbi:hypothetical protein LINPERPRIM_LOCUS22517 [Linum perenne]
MRSYNHRKHKLIVIACCIIHNRVYAIRDELFDKFQSGPPTVPSSHCNYNNLELVNSVT